MARIVVRGDFGGPNFVRGLALQKENFQVFSSTVAVLPAFVGGFDTESTVTMVVYGTGFGITDDGRYTGRVSSFTATDNYGNSWTVHDYGPSLNTLNTASIENTFVDNLLGPTQWDYVGNQFEDVFIGAAFADNLVGFGGNDVFEGLGGDDTILGGAGNDTLRGQQGDDFIRGGQGHDFIYGGTEQDSLFGDKGNDEIYGGAGADFIGGGVGNDILRGEAGSDKIVGGEGFDRIFGGAGEDSILGNVGNDRLFGQDGADTVRGGEGNDLVNGGGGVDVLLGDPGDDTVQGGTAADFVIGGMGNDVLAGNAANFVSYDSAPDTFLFAGCFGNDTVADFELDWDALWLLGVTEDDVTVQTVNVNDVLVTLNDYPDRTILVEDVANEFDKDVDIVFIDTTIDDVLGVL